MSLFSSSKTKAQEIKNVSLKTGRYIDGLNLPLSNSLLSNNTKFLFPLDMVMTLIEGAHDRDGTVQNEIEDSLYEIGLHETDLVLSSCAAFLERNLKVLNLWSENFGYII